MLSKGRKKLTTFIYSPTISHYIFLLCLKSFTLGQLFVYSGRKNAHEILSLKVPNVEFDFDVSDRMLQVVTDTSKVGNGIS